MSTRTDPLRRLPLPAVLVAVVLLLLAGCAGAPAPAEPSGDAAFPVTVEHAYGATTLPARPQRVVALGTNDVAVARAVGADVVGGLENAGESRPQAPYLEPFPDGVLTISELEPLPLERIAAFRPDVILAVSSYLVTDRAAYEQLSAIAPTVMYRTSLFGSPMQDDARQIGVALGETERVEELIARADEAVAAVRAEAPGLPGRTVLVGQARGDVLPVIVGEPNQATTLLGALGLEPPASFTERPPSGAEIAPGTVGLSYEEAGRLAEADLVIMSFPTAADRARFEASPVVAQALSGVTYLPITLDQAIALQAPSVVSVGWLLDTLGARTW
ncbi:iron-siderophore ABC transporter substrate-binding protein [Pseudonocardia kongjuensis]|uniref:Iron-siderophore ABC transporter substrate-binding protein n=1 Tax=Pseudonocardia kongjuensis TaxID=102227 RepID=A0ABN1XM07_9PSEU